MENTTVYSPMKSVFYQILRNALWQKGEIPQSINPEVFAEIWQMAKEQSVSGLVAEAMVRNNVKTNPQITMKLLINQKKHLNLYAVMQKTLWNLTDVLNEINAEYVVFKGQLLAMLYPIPALRTAGDIDFYVPEKDFDLVFKRLSDKLKVKKAGLETEKHLNFYLNGVDCEMHHRLETFGCSSHQRYFDNLIDVNVKCAQSIKVGDSTVKILSVENNILLVFKHLFNHLMVEGVGLRQVCDLALLLDGMYGKYNPESLMTNMKKIGYHRAFRAMCALLVDELGLDANKCPCRITAYDRWWAKRLLNEIEKRGNFGKYNRKHTTPGVAKSIETAGIAFSHFMKFLPLAPNEILHLIPQRIIITLNKYRNKNNYG